VIFTILALMVLHVGGLMLAVVSLSAVLDYLRGALWP
jgi:hypothetical protein